MTTVRLKFTGEIRSHMHTGQIEFAFDGGTLGELLEAFFAQHDLRRLILDESGQVLPHTRVVVNGRFSNMLGDLQTQVREGDTVTLIRPYLVAV